jgi:hypothetical protein
VLGHGYDCDVRSGAGATVCGEFGSSVLAAKSSGETGVRTAPRPAGLFYLTGLHGCTTGTPHSACLATPGKGSGTGNGGIGTSGTVTGGTTGTSGGTLGTLTAGTSGTLGVSGTLGAGKLGVGSLRDGAGFPRPGVDGAAGELCCGVDAGSPAGVGVTTAGAFDRFGCG